MKRASQLTLTFPQKDIQYREVLMRMKEQEDLNISAFILRCIKRELGTL